MIKKSSIRKGLRCPIEKSEMQTFFSMVDYRNNLFTSNDPKKIMEFYDGFENREQLIQWMKERPKGVPYIHEVEGDKDIIVVILTADYNGKYATECRNNIFKGIHMIFVESGGENDFYFNIAHYMNAGMMKALDYNPKWILYSGDDMYKIDEVSKLVNDLKNLDEKETDAVFTNETIYHSRRDRVVRRNIFESLNQFRYSKSLGFKVNRLKRKFSVRYSIVRYRKINHILFSGMDFVSFIDFAILSANFVKRRNGNIFDETFINNMEDSDLSLSVMLTKCRVHKIGYRIGDFIGSSLGTGIDRSSRDLASAVYFTYKYESILERII
jgi:hypothetical protein